MGLGKRCSTRGNERLGCVRFSRSFGRERVVISNDMEIDSCFVTPMKMHCEGNCGFVSVIESLPQDILVSPDWPNSFLISNIFVINCILMFWICVAD